MSNTGAGSGREWRPETIRDLLTTDRLRSYLASCDQDLVRALELYEWNLTASAAIMQTAATVEVVVRNALDVQLKTWAKGRTASSWLEGVPLDARGLADIEKARKRATRHGRATLSHGKVVAELNLASGATSPPSGTTQACGSRRCTLPSPTATEISAFVVDRSSATLLTSCSFATVQPTTSRSTDAISLATF